MGTDNLKQVFLTINIIVLLILPLSLLAQQPLEEKLVKITELNTSTPLEGVISRKVYGDTAAVYIANIQKGAKSSRHLHAVSRS